MSSNPSSNEGKDDKSVDENKEIAEDDYEEHFGFDLLDDEIFELESPFETNKIFYESKLREISSVDDFEEDFDMMKELEGYIEFKFDHISPGKSFQSHCIRCWRRESEVRFLKRNRRKQGPYDRYCAYEIVNGAIPAFVTKPETKMEMLYQIITNNEIPTDPKKLAIFKIRLVMVVFVAVIGFILSNFPFFYLLLTGNYELILTSYTLYFLFYCIFSTASILIFWVNNERIKFNKDIFGLDNLHQKEVFDGNSNLYFLRSLGKLFLMIFVTSPYYLTIGLSFYIIISVDILFMLSIPITLWYILEDSGDYIGSFFSDKIIEERLTGKVKLVGKHFLGNGFDHLENFELKWDGKIKSTSLSLEEMKEDLHFAVIRVIIGIIPVIFYINILSKFSINLLFGFYSILICFSLFFAVTTLLDNEYYRFLNFNNLDYRKLPEDLYQEMIIRYFTNLYPPKTRPQNKIQKLLRFRRTEFSGWQIFCPICKQDIETGDNVIIQCTNCLRLFHEDHLMTFFSEISENDCPVCQTTLEGNIKQFEIHNPSTKESK